MKLKLGPKEIALYRVAKVVRAADNVAKIYFHTGEAILVRCAVDYPDRYRFSYPGTVEELKAFIDKQKAKRSRRKRSRDEEIDALHTRTHHQQQP